MLDSWRLRLRFMWRYVRGRVPWDSGIVPPEVVAWVERVGRPGRALDLGCGTGTTSLYLAARGWTVLGVDFAPNAIWRARQKAAQRGLLPGSVRFEVADVTRQGFLPGEAPFDLLVDVGCLHSLAAERRAVYAAHAGRLAAPGAGYLLYAFMPHMAPYGRPRGLTPDEVRALLAPAFEVETMTIGEEVTSPRPSAWYTLRRTESAV